MEPLHLLRTLRRRWRPIAALAILGAALGFASSAVEGDATPVAVSVTRYDACHTLLVDSSIPTNVESWDVRNLGQLAQRVTAGEIPEAVAAAEGIDSADASARVRVIVRNDIQSMTICTVGESPTGTERLADAFATELVAFLTTEAEEFQTTRVASAQERAAAAEQCRIDAEAEIARILDADADADVTAQNQDVASCRLDLAQRTAEVARFTSAGTPVVPLESLESARANSISEGAYERQLRAGAAGTAVTVGVDDSVSNAAASTNTASGTSVPDGPLTRGLAGAVLGALAGLGYVLFTERLDSKLRRKEDVESTLDLPVLAEVPPLTRAQRRQTEVVSVREPRSRTAESYRALRSALDYARSVDIERGTAREGAQVVMVTSAGPSEGKTTSLANLAAIMAEGDRSVLSVNCDFRRPRLHRYLGGDIDAQRVNTTEIPGVELVTQVTPSDGDNSPSDVVAAQRRLVEQARDRFDVILLDTAPVLTTNDAAELLPVVDQVVLVIAAGQTDADSAARAIEVLERRGHPPLGVALVGARDVPNSLEYYYDDHDPYLQPERRRRTRRRSKDEAESTLSGSDLAAK